MGPFEALFLVCALILVVVIFLIKEKRLEDPDRLDTIYVEQMREACSLGEGPVVATLIRQSGNLYRDLGTFDTAEAAMNAIEKSFRRGKIESVFLQENTQARFQVIRLHRSDRGKAEGKKLGGAVIERA